MEFFIKCWIGFVFTMGAILTLTAFALIALAIYTLLVWSLS